MEALARRLRSFSTDDVLPIPWPSLAELISPRPGDLVECLAAPGVGKSTIALHWMVQLAAQNWPGLYVSLDTSLHDQAARFVAAWHRIPIAEVQADLDNWIDWLSGLELPMRFADISIDVDDVRALIEAEAQWFGEYPKFVVIDNMADIVADETQGEYQHAFNTLHAVARETGCIIFALHHIKRGSDEMTSGLEMPKLGSGMFAGERGVQITLGLCRPYDGYLNVGVLKNRMGRASPYGAIYTALRCDLERSFIWEE